MKLGGRLNSRLVETLPDLKSSSSLTVSSSGNLRYFTCHEALLGWHTVACICSYTHGVSILHLQSRERRSCPWITAGDADERLAFLALERRPSQALKMAPRPAGVDAWLPLDVELIRFPQNSGQLWQDSIEEQVGEQSD